jgi:hypothetical protein
MNMKWERSVREREYEVLPDALSGQVALTDKARPKCNHTDQADQADQADQKNPSHHTGGKESGGGDVET